MKILSVELKLPDSTITEVKKREKQNFVLSTGTIFRVNNGYIWRSQCMCSAWCTVVRGLSEAVIVLQGITDMGVTFMSEPGTSSLAGGFLTLSLRFQRQNRSKSESK